MQMPDGTVRDRMKGIPQGGVISPLLVNLFLHYAFDKWMDKKHPGKPFARYADDAVAHCCSLDEVKKLRESLEGRLKECKLELHPTKTRIIYCKDDDRRGNYPDTSFDFLGYTFRPRRSKNKYGKFFINFTPAVSRKAQIAMRQEIRRWNLHLRNGKSINDLSSMFNPVFKGWINYYGCYYKAEMYGVLKHMNRALVRWAMRKYKKLARHQRRATYWLGRLPEGNQSCSSNENGDSTRGWMMGAG